MLDSMHQPHFVYEGGPLPPVPLPCYALDPKAAAVWPPAHDQPSEPHAFVAAARAEIRRYLESSNRPENLGRNARLEEIRVWSPQGVLVEVVTADRVLPNFTVVPEGFERLAGEEHGDPLAAAEAGERAAAERGATLAGLCEEARGLGARGIRASVFTPVLRLARVG